MSIRILLVRPPEKYELRPACGIPLGLMYLASSLQNNGYEVQIYDALAEVDFDDAGKRSSKRGMTDLLWKPLESKIRQSRPDIIGITNRFSAEVESAVVAAAVAKNVDTTILTVIGGNHASVSPQTFFDETTDVDIVCLGEGEVTMLDIVRYRQGKKKLEDVEGIAFRKNGRMVINGPRAYIKNLDTLPFPSYDLVNLESYFSAVRKGHSGRAIYPYRGSQRTISMITSRGCPYECVFCSIRLHMGRQWRCHSAQYVLDHLEHVVTKYGVRHVHFEDDNLTLDLPRFVSILDGIVEKRLGITWDTPNGVRADFLTKDILINCKRAGCTYLFIGVESGVQQVLDQVIRKRLSLEAVRRVARWCYEIGLNLGAFYVIGFPGESKSDMEQTLEFALKMEHQFGVVPVSLIATPLVGTELYQNCLDNGYLALPLTPLNLSRSLDGIGMIKTEDFTPEEVAKLRTGFFRKHKQLMVRNFVLFLLQHPRALRRFLSNVFAASRGRIKAEILSNMFLSNCLLRETGNHVQCGS